MKNLYILVTLMLSLNMSAQNYIPMPESDAVWIQAAFIYSMMGHEHTTITNPLSFVEDSIIEGIPYNGLKGHQIVEWIDGWGNPQNYQTGTYFIPEDTFYIRQDIPSRKVFMRFQNQDTLLYDFDLMVGQIYPETVMNINYPNLLVMGQDSIQLLDGIYHKRWALGTEPSDSGYITLIEGVGASSGFSLPMYPLFEQSGAIMCMKTSGNQVYENWASSGLIPAKYSEFCEENVSIIEIFNNSNEVKVWPNPVDDIVNVFYKNGIESLLIVDALGRTVFVKSGESESSIELIIDSIAPGQYLFLIKTSDQKELIQKVVLK